MNYACIHENVVVEVFSPIFYDVEVRGPTNEDGSQGAVLHAVGDEVLIGDRFTPEFVAALVAIPANAAVVAGDSYDGANFGPPPVTPVAAPGVPLSVTMRQARLALLAAGKLQAVADAIAGLPSPQREAAQIEWEFASTVERSSAFLESLATLLELSSDDLDELFTAAVQL